jgi:general secretion pathway protein A
MPCRTADETIAVAFVTNSMLGFEGILEYMLEDPASLPGQSSPAQRLFALQHFLIERRRTGQNTVLILDEAQDLDPHTLEQIRLLSNFETTSEKILQIVLVGQPELRSRLDLPELRQLKQRIGLRSSIPPLTPDQVRGYIRTRLRIAGTHDFGLFSPEAIARIADYSAGVPRPSTRSVTTALFAYAEQIRRIGRETVEEAIQYLDDGEPARPKPHNFSAGGRRASGGRCLASAAMGGLALPAAPGHGLTVLTGFRSPISARRAPALPGKFFKALEQAKRDRALREEGQPEPARLAEAPPAESPAIKPAASSPPPVVDAAEGLDEHLVSLVTPAAYEAEQYRSLRHTIEQMHRESDLKVIAVSSPGMGDGKTLTTSTSPPPSPSRPTRGCS